MSTDSIATNLINWEIYTSYDKLKYFGMIIFRNLNSELIQ